MNNQKHLEEIEEIGFSIIPNVISEDEAKELKTHIKLALNEELAVEELRRRDQGAMAIRYFEARPGIITAIKGYEELKNQKWVSKSLLFCAVGDVVENPSNHTKRVGFVHALGNDAAEAESRVMQALELVSIETEPLTAQR